MRHVQAASESRIGRGGIVGICIGVWLFITCAAVVIFIKKKKLPNKHESQLFEIGDSISNPTPHCTRSGRTGPKRQEAKIPRYPVTLHIRQPSSAEVVRGGPSDSVMRSTSSLPRAKSRIPERLARNILPKIEEDLSGAENQTYI
ncbi:hypothetical protein I7I51_01982 [Histoplasma capsulatum]|uniref:Uncharacterized protein n=1 Tax=Ajellomyces capsulatus TaxID=5037 RepID=A0A8A1MLF4_AJECA|nr:hypothetical protein I7I51_01982 [Histoplasma capsulatum]